MIFLALYVSFHKVRGVTEQSEEVIRLADAKKGHGSKSGSNIQTRARNSTIPKEKLLRQNVSRSNAMPKLENPHDRFFKDVFSKREAARDFLINYLPREVTALIDLEFLEISKDSFVDEELQEHFCDILPVQKQAEGRCGGLYRFPV